jgi:hypothetical protein
MCKLISFPIRLDSATVPQNVHEGASILFTFETYMGCIGKHSVKAGRCKVGSMKKCDT